MDKTRKTTLLKKLAAPRYIKDVAEGKKTPNHKNFATANYIINRSEKLLAGRDAARMLASSRRTKYPPLKKRFHRSAMSDAARGGVYKERTRAAKVLQKGELIPVEEIRNLDPHLKKVRGSKTDRRALANQNLARHQRGARRRRLAHMKADKYYADVAKQRFEPKETPKETPKPKTSTRSKVKVRIKSGLRTLARKALTKGR